MRKENPLIQKGDTFIAKCQYGHTNHFTLNELSVKLGKDISKWEEKLKNEQISFECEHGLCGNDVEITSIVLED